MTAHPWRNYLAIFDINPATPAKLAGTVPILVGILRDVAGESPEQVFRSTGGDHFAFFFESALPAGQVRARIESPKNAAPVLSGNDRFLLIEVGKDFAGQQGFSRATTWLQRHAK